MKHKDIEFVDSSESHLDKKRVWYVRKYLFKLYALKYIPIYFLIAAGGLIGIIVAFLWWVICTMFFDHRDLVSFSPTINVWFGVPGSGKTSVAAWLTRNSIKAGFRVLSNVALKDAYVLDEADLGAYDMSFAGDGCHVIYDEATINGMDNRDFKKFVSSNKPLYFSLHRHMNNRVDVFSQGYDIDKRIRDRAGSSGLFYLKKFPLKGFVMYRRIKKVLFIKKEDKQMIDGFSYTGLPRLLYVRSVWDSFDTLDMSLCPKQQKEWKKWEC